MCSSENSRFFPQWFLIHLGEETQFIREWELSARGFWPGPDVYAHQARLIGPLYLSIVKEAPLSD